MKKKKQKFKVGDLLIRVKPVWDQADKETNPWYYPGQLLKVVKITPQMYRYEYLNQPTHPKGCAKFEEIERTCTKANKMSKVLYGEA